MYSPFKAGVYQGTGQETRVNLDLQVTEELHRICDQYDKYFEQELKKINPKAAYHRLVQEPE